MSKSIFLLEKIQFNTTSKINYNFYNEEDEFTNDLLIDLKANSEEGSGINYSIEISNIKSTIRDIRNKNIFSIEIGEELIDASERFLLQNIDRQVNVIINSQKEFFIENYVFSNMSNDYISDKPTFINDSIYEHINVLNNLNNRDYVEDLNSDIDASLINNRQSYNFLLSKDVAEKSFLGYKNNINIAENNITNDLKHIYEIKKNGIRANIFIGFILRKFKKVNDSFTFIKSNILKVDIYKPLDEIDEVLTFYDDAVKLNEEYYYEIAPLYCISSKSNNLNDVDSFKSSKFHEDSSTYYYLVSGENVHTKVVEAINKKIPGEPQGLSGFYNKSLKCPRLIWDRPIDYKLGISGYQVYRRRNLESPFELLKTIMFDKSNLQENIDLNLVQREEIEKNYYDLIDSKDNENFIYAVCAVGKNRKISNLSSQIIIYKSNEKDSIEVDFVAYSGAKRDYPNTKIPSNISISRENNDVIDYVSKIKNKNDITIYLTPDCGSINNNKIFYYDSNDTISYNENSHYVMSVTSKDMTSNSKISFRVKSIVWYLTIEIK